MHYGLLESTPPGKWVPDVFAGFSRRTLPLGEDNEGPITATLVRHDEAVGIPLLYIHGWSDYFYNTELAKAAKARGYQLYALKLRKYGRSLRPKQTPGYIEDLAEYDARIAAALPIPALSQPNTSPSILAPSTGGLTAALWADRHPGQFGGLVLNAPWLELQGNTWLRGFANTIADPIWRSAPERKLLLPKFDYFYQSLSNNAYGEWVLHPLWHPRYSFDIHGGWLAAVLAGHAQVHDGLDIDTPVLVMTSADSYFATKYSARMQVTDTVIDVHATAQRAIRLGNQVMIHKIPNALHDVYASAKAVRDQAFDATFAWLDYFRR